MVPKRPFHGDSGDGTDSPAQDPKRLKNAIRDVLGLLSMQDMVTRIEPFLRLVVRDEVERTVQRVLQFQPSFRPSFHQTETSGARGLLLQFVNRPPATIFTGSNIETEDGNPIRIELLDANSKTLVTSGPLSSMKIEILVLDGDFGLDDREDWSENEFNANVIREREGRRPLVTGGDLNVTLRAGIGMISDIIFTDNSSWQRSRKFRLGARPVPKTCGEARIREARSEAFVVKDHRGELYKKHHPPSLDDEIWRLERIAKGGASHKKLAEYGIHTVRDFLQIYEINPSELRKVLGCGISNKIWDIIIDHANECVLDDKFYTYFEAGQSVGLLFNSVYKLIGAAFDGPMYKPLDELAPSQRALVESLKQQAYKNVACFILIDARDIFGPSRSLACPQSQSFNGPNPSLQQIEFPVARQDQAEMLLDFNPMGNQLECSGAQNPNPLQVFPSTLRNSFKFRDIFSVPYPGENNWSTSLSQWPLMTSSQPTPEDISQAQTSTWSPANTFYFSSDNEGELGIISSHPSFCLEKSKAGWCKLRAAIIWGSVRREVATKRMLQSFCI
ncbi:hypothetical protein P3X46_008580 [Hevea brasiliensis]|uniref:Uncharacterized protein n=1 Tax=Hevea brasiliensis TaxID=3981 RepID=A0ABQ9MK62_HEVBR|nr:calmodulin-binding protein 60 B isoform X2 [Hevea brasiliensis]KAJ9180318.1 hypothetical protein P3X46_008580 [Hevea brasiliensis]